MVNRAALIAALAVLPALASCKDYDRNNKNKTATGTETSRGTTYGGGSSPSASSGTGGTTGGGSATAPSGAAHDETSATDTMGRRGTESSGIATGTPIASAKLAGSVNGSVSFLASTKDSDKINAAVDLEGAPAGAYSIYLFKGSDCTAIQQMKAPSTDLGAKEDQKKTGWKSVGNVSVAQGGKVSMQLPVTDVDKDDLSKESVVVFPTSATGTGATGSQGAVACGQLHSSAAAQPSG